MSLCTVPGTRPSGSPTGRLIPGLKGRACSPAPGTAPTDITGPPRSGRKLPPPPCGPLKGFGPPDNRRPGEPDRPGGTIGERALVTILCAAFTSVPTVLPLPSTPMMRRPPSASVNAVISRRSLLEGALLNSTRSDEAGEPPDRGNPAAPPPPADRATSSQAEKTLHNRPAKNRAFTTSTTAR